MVKRQTRLAPGLSFVGAVQAGAITSLPLWTSTRMRSLMVKPACSSHCPARRSQKEAGLFNYTPLQKIGDVVQSDPAGVAKDVSKVAIGGVTAKTGGALCTTGLGCVAGGWMVAFGLSESVEGGSGLYNRYNGISAPADNLLRWGFNQVLPAGWGNVAYDGLNFAFSVAALKAPVPLNMGVADGLNRPVSMFGVTVLRIDNVNLLPFIKQPWPYGTTQGLLLLGVGSKGATVINDVRQTGDKK
jgi:filamentous hemagglutinin